MRLAIPTACQEFPCAQPSSTHRPLVTQSVLQITIFSISTFQVASGYTELSLFARKLPWLRFWRLPPGHQDVAEKLSRSQRAEEDGPAMEQRLKFSLPWSTPWLNISTSKELWSTTLFVIVESCQKCSTWIRKIQHIPTQSEPLVNIL